MAVTYASFIAERPSFSEVAETIVETKIAYAQSGLDPAHLVNPVLYDHAISLKVAHLLTIEPYGMPIGPEQSPNMTSYEEEYKKVILKGYRRGHITGGGLS